MQFNKDQEKIKFSGFIFYNINGKWWKIKKEKMETYSTGSGLIETIVPVIEKEITFEEITKKYLRIKKLERILDEETIKSNMDKRNDD